jgi:hypothetical protein
MDSLNLAESSLAEMSQDEVIVRARALDAAGSLGLQSWTEVAGFVSLDDER